MPPVIPSRPRAMAPEPANRLVYPWRFRLGDAVYALGHSSSFTVVGGELWMSCPHLHAVGIDGRTWRLPQLHCATKPISTLVS